MKLIPKATFFISLLIAGLVLHAAYSEGPGIVGSEVNTKDDAWLDTAINATSHKVPIRITVKTPNETEIFEGMRFHLIYMSGKVTRKNGVDTYSDDAMVVIRHFKSRPAPAEVKQFKADWISVHWVKLKQANK